MTTVIAKTSVREVAYELLAELGFSVSDSTASAASPLGEWRYGEIRYEGPPDGLIRCWSSQVLAVDWAANLLGLDPEQLAARGVAEAGLREFMSLFCGRFTSEVQGTAGAVRVARPQARLVHKPPNGGAAVEYIQVNGQPLYLAHARLR